MVVETVPGTLTLEVAQPCDFVASVESGQSHRWEKDGDWHWCILAGRIIKARSLVQVHGSLTIEYEASDQGNHGEMEEELSRYFRFDDDLEAIYEDISGDSRVASMVDRYRGLRLLRVDPWECLLSFICSANSNLARIHANVEDMARSLGTAVSLNGKTRYILPEPEVLAAAGESFLRGLGLGFRAPYVAYAAQAVASGQIDLEELKGIPYMEAKGRLMELYGVGSKIADCVLLHSLEKIEAFPIDVWVRRALLDWYFPGQKPPPDKVLLEWALDYFGPNAGYAELYQFHGRRLKKSREGEGA